MSRSWVADRSYCPTRTSLAESRLLCPQMEIVWTSILTGVVLGMSIGNVAGIIHSHTFRSEVDDADVAGVENFSSATFLGGLFGSILAGYLADFMGRKQTMSIGAKCILIGSVYGSFVLDDTIWGLILSRFLIGLGVSALAHTSPVLFAEISSKENRGFILGCFEVGFSVGILLAYMLSDVLDSESEGVYRDSRSDDGKENWKILMVAPSFAALVLDLTVHFCLPKSPRWLVLCRRSYAARNVLLSLHRFGDNDEDDERLRYQRARQVESKLRIMERRSEGPTSSSNENPRVDFFAIEARSIAVMVLQVLCGVDIFTVFGLLVMTRFGLTDKQAQTLLVSTGATHVVCGILALPLIDRIGRRRLLQVGSLVMCAALCTLAFTYASPPSQSSLNVFWWCTLLYCASFAVSWGPCSALVAAEMLPLPRRAKGMAHAVAANFVAGAVVCRTFLSLLSGVGMTETLLLFAAVCVAALIFVTAFLEEGASRELEECSSPETRSRA